MTGLAGAVLCGGESRRMGRPKAFIEIDGVAMAVRVAEALRNASCDPVIAVGGDRERLSALGLVVVDDPIPGDGPATATITALRALGAGVTIVSACDLVEPAAAVLRRLVDALEGTDALAAVPTVGGHAQHQVRAYRSDALPIMTARHERGERSIRGLVPARLVVEIEVVDAASVADADRPDDLPEGAE